MLNKTMVGRLNKRIAIKRERQIDDGSGGKISSFATLSEAWASVFNGSGSENYTFKAVFGLNNYVFVVRNRADIAILTSDIVEFNGVQMNIKHVNRVDNMDLYLTIECEQGLGV